MLALTRFLLSAAALALSAVAPTTTFATLVPVATDPTNSRAVSTSRIDKVIATSGWTVTLTTVEVHDNGHLKFNVAYHKNSGATNYIYCPTALFRDELFITLNDGTRIDPIDWSCKYQRGQTEYDNDMTLWARFPGVAKGYMPLTLKWYNWGLLSEITLSPPSADALTIDYFALGDSVPASAGGIVDNTPCKHSTQSYPLQVGHALAMRHDKLFFYRLACWGATYDGNAAVPDSSLRHQVDQILPTISSRPTLVTVTFGANEMRITDPSFVFFELLPKSDSDLSDWIERETLNVHNEIFIEGGRILKGHGNVRLVITDYGNPLNTSATTLRAKSEKIFTRLSAQLARASQRLSSLYPTQVAFAPVRDSFQGHEQPQPTGTCSLTGYVVPTNNPPDIPYTWWQNANGSPTLPGPGDPNSNVNDCFHPNLLGAAAYVAAINKAVKQFGNAF